MPKPLTPKINKLKVKTQIKSLTKKPKKSTSSCFKIFFELLLFCLWLLCTGFSGYFLGRAPILKDCPTSQQFESKKNPTCVYEEQGSGLAIGATNPDKGYTYDELQRMWKCSQASFNFSQANQQIIPREGNLDKTKWKTILSVDPRSFFDKYLTQYPADVKSVQPVVVFSHKPLKNFNEISDVCKVLDIALVPDTPGVCVAVTETYHDVASYHLLHADKQPDGTFALTSNHIKDRILPDETAYSAARALLIDYFDHVDYVAAAVKGCPRFGKGRVSVGVLLESMDELKLFKNSLASAAKQRISNNKYCVFTTSKTVSDSVNERGIKIVLLSDLETVGRGKNTVEPLMRTHFLQAWLAFAVANNNNKMLWQSPGTIWLEKPDNVIADAPVAETQWSFKGRKDARAAPFFISFDFFVTTGNERPVHLLHEAMLHFDLVLAWSSMDSVVAYRLSENNSRYGTTVSIFPPYKVLHVDLMAGDPEKIKQAVSSRKPPQVIVFPREGRTAIETKELLINSNLWFIEK